MTEAAWRPQPPKPFLEEGGVKVGDLVGGGDFAVWRVVEVRPVEDVDLDDVDRQRIMSFRSPFRERWRPINIRLRHENGPIPLTARRLHDGTFERHVRAGNQFAVDVVAEPYQTCSCHGHPWPCQEMVNQERGDRAVKQLDRLMLTATPGFCAACLEPISSRQPAVTFPEPSLLVPGADGPTFHVGRGNCWYHAGRYETEHRLPAYPGAERLVTCPGHLFVHRIGFTEDCSEGGLCTGHHGPVARQRKRVYRHGDCDVRYYEDSVSRFHRPHHDCGWRGTRGRACLYGVDL